MKDRNTVGAEWLRSTLLVEDDKVCVTEEMDRVSDVRTIDEFMISMATYGRDLVIKIVKGRLKVAREDMELYAAFLRSLHIDLGLLRQVFPRGRLSPYFELYTRHLGSRHRIQSMLDHGNVDGLNTILKALRGEARTREFRTVIDKHRRASRKNGDSAIRYVRALFECYSRLLVIRLDLTYQGEYVKVTRRLLMNQWAKGNGPVKDPIAPEDVLVHRGEFLLYLRKTYPSLVGYIWKIEHGVYKSFHAHWVIFLNGHESMRDEVIGRMMGEHWRQVITCERGSYWNVNSQKNKNEYEKRDLLGVGEINWYDTAAREKLERVVLYLAKVDYFVRLEAPGFVRIFGRGEIPKRTKKQVGRPRGSVENVV
jgi:hypothetical protein